jgi:hypothetical protein
LVELKCFVVRPFVSGNWRADVFVLYRGFPESQTE